MSASLRWAAPGRKGFPRVVRSSITLTVPLGGDVSYAEVLRRSRREIDLPSLGISDLQFRKAVNGGHCFRDEGGDEASAKADALAAKFRGVWGESGVRVARSSKRVELRVRGFDESIFPCEIVQAVAELGGCPAEDIRLEEIRGPQFGLRSVWVQCPVVAGGKIAVAGKVRLGWVTAPVDGTAGPMRCHCCLEREHVLTRCPGPDRSGRCYRCGDSTYNAVGCRAKTLCCPLCSDLGKPAGINSRARLTPRK